MFTNTTDTPYYTAVLKYVIQMLIGQSQDYIILLDLPVRVLFLLLVQIVPFVIQTFWGITKFKYERTKKCILVVNYSKWHHCTYKRLTCTCRPLQIPGLYVWQVNQTCNLLTFSCLHSEQNLPLITRVA